MDASSLFIGVGIGAVGAFGTGFLKKAGEDSYAWLKGKVHPKSVAPTTPQVIVHLRDDRESEQEGGTPSPYLAPASIERVNQVHFDDIEKAIDAAPPMQRDRVANTYVGLKVEWDTYLRAATLRENGEVSLRLAVDKDYRGRSVVCTVQGDEYRLLGVLPRGAHIRVSGEITRVWVGDVELSNVRLQFISSATAA